jgi:hypothetical protein
MMLLQVAMLAAALTSQQEPGREMAEIQVHEWGVVTFDAFIASAESSPDSIPPGIPDYPVVERAPVVYFHGPEFTGTFTATATDGVLTDLYPVVPGSNPGQTYSWDIGAAQIWPADRDSRRGLSYSSGTWDMTGWRVPYSLWLRTSDGFEDGFLFYEASVNATSGFPVRYMQSLDAAISLNPDLPAALVVPGDDGPKVIAAERLEILPGFAPVRQARICREPEDLRSVLYDWSIDTIDIDEVDVLWATWQGWFLDEGLRDLPEGCGLLLYPLPAGMQDMVSTIELSTNEGFQVSYRRFLICAVPVVL